MSLVRRLRVFLRPSESSVLVVLLFLVFIMSGILVVQLTDDDGQGEEVSPDSAVRENALDVKVGQLDEVQEKNTVDEPPKIKNTTYDVLLNSYMRSGSTLTGIVFGWRDDSFYLYEPLWKMSRWAYWHGNDSVCRMDRLDCQKIAPSEAASKEFVFNKENLPGQSLNLALDVLNRAYDCDVHAWERLVVSDDLAAKLGGSSWAPFRKCRDHKTMKQCLPEVARTCKEASHRVSKVLRLTLDLVERLLQQRPTLKVIHLFRDPRAVLNSRIETKWYPAKTREQIIANAKSLCHKMVVDFTVGQELIAKYPERFRFLFYEDLNTNPYAKVKLLYKYLGMSLAETKYMSVKQLPVFNINPREMNEERVKNTAFWWRKTLEWDVVKAIDAICGDVYPLLGYKKFKNEKQLRDLSISSAAIAKEYLVTDQ